MFSDEWSEEKSLERFEEYLFNYFTSRIYLSSIKYRHIRPKRSANRRTLRPSKPVNLTERSMRIPKVPYEKNVAFNHGPYSPVHMEPS